MTTLKSIKDHQIQVADTSGVINVSSYPVDMSSFLTDLNYALDITEMPRFINPTGYHSMTNAIYALAHWNQYLTTLEETHLYLFMAQANWLVEHENLITADSSGWLISSPHPDVHTNGSWLSALTQGSGISVLIRAYQLTQEDAFLEVAHRAVQTFNRDILDGGVSTPIGEDGVFFEEIAIYPARHSLSGFIFALIGLYDYVALTEDTQIKEIIERSLLTFHILLDEFDARFWTRVNLLHRRLASYSQLSLHAELIGTLASYSGCDHCLELSFRWKHYQHDLMSRLHYFIANRCTFYNHAFLKQLRKICFLRRTPISDPRLNVCIPITGFPLMGGTRAVLAGLAKVTAEIWQIEYLTQRIGPNPDGLIIHQFGMAKMSPWQFPMIWFYFLAGLCKNISLLYRGNHYEVILPQDGVFTAAFAALAAKLAGVRVVCIDHGNLVTFQSQIYRAERIESLTKKLWLRRLVERLMFVWYWPSLFLLSQISAHFVDQFLIPGVVGDGTEEMCRNLGIPTSRIMRFGSMIDTSRYSSLDLEERARIRAKYGIANEAIVIALICRLSPEKGLDIALEAISRMFTELSPEKRSQIHIIIAGDGPLRADIERDIQMRRLSQRCVIWGETSATDVISLLGISDIFLYTSKRGACLSMAVLEAMASGCAVVASIRPLSNVQLLAEGRGFAVPAANVEETSIALKKLVNDLELCRSMGRLAREYVARQHSPAMLKRVLMRATFWSELDEFLKLDTESKG